MRTIFSILLIMVLVQTTVSARAEQQDVTVTAVMKGSTTISGQKIEYPKTDEAEMKKKEGDAAAMKKEDEAAAMKKQEDATMMKKESDAAMEKTDSMMKQ